jgi:hypothetical protein
LSLDLKWVKRWITAVCVSANTLFKKEKFLTKLLYGLFWSCSLCFDSPSVLDYLDSFLIKTRSSTRWKKMTWSNITKKYRTWII